MVAELAGLMGMSLILSAFVMNQIHKLRDDCLEYDGVNAAGSILLVYYAFTIASWPFLLLNLIWFAVSMKGVLLGLNKSGRTGKRKARLERKKK